MNIKNFLNKLQKLNTAQIITLGFAGVIILGGLFLWLPFCVEAGETTSFTDAMFTAATCVCVTGLVTVVTATHWTLIGKIAILVLIQIGGVGVITLASIIFISLRRKISMRNRKMIQESYNLDSMSGLVQLVKTVVKCVLGAELVGAVFYSFCFIPEYGILKGIGQSVFTSVSAFCNAGVDILGDSSFAPYVKNPIVNFTTMGLVIMAGLGFPVWWDLWNNIKKVVKRQTPVRRFFKNLRFQSKIVITTTGILLLVGMVLIFIFEFNNPETIGDMSLGEKIMASAFQSMTTRTAGFLTIDQAAFSNATVVLCLFLMLIGGSPMGTAGGVKTTTLAVIVLSIITNLKGNSDVEVYNRRIKDSYIRSAVVVMGAGVAVMITMSMLLAAAMPNADLIDIVYEVTSAIATVGLSRGLTPMLTTAGKWIIIITMFLGRIGPTTLGFAVISKGQKHSENIHLAEADVMIG